VEDSEKEKLARQRIYQKRYRERNREKLRLKAKEYNEANKDKLAFVKIGRYQKNKETILKRYHERKEIRNDK